MRRAVTALLSTVAVLAAGLVTGTAPPARAATDGMDIAGFVDMAVDEAHDTVLVVQGSSSSQVAVLGLDGSSRAPIDDMAGAVDVHLSADGSSYFITLEEQHAIAVVDAATLGVTKIPLGPDVCPTSVAEDDGVLWFAYSDCVVTRRSIGSVSLDDRVVTTDLQSAGSPWPWRIETSPGLPGRLVVLSGSELQLLDVSGGPTATPLPGPRAAVGNVFDFLVTPDGKEVVTTASTPSDHIGLSTTDMSLRTVYPTGNGPHAVAARSDGMLALGVHGTYADDLFLYPEGSATPFRTYDTSADDSVIRERGLAFGARDLYFVTWRSSPLGRPPYTFHRVTPRLASAMTLSLGAATVDYGQAARVDLHLAWPNAPVTISATTYSGTRRTVYAGLTDASGNVRISQWVRDRTTFEAVYAGDDERDASTRSTTVAVRARVEAEATKVVGRSGSYRLVRSGTEPTVLTTVRANNAGKCVRFESQQPRSSGWGYTWVSTCLKLGARSQTSIWFNDSWTPGSRVRVRVVYDGGAKNAGNRSPWVYLTFVT